MSKPISPFAEFVQETLEPFTPVRVRPMFGGYGLFSHDVMFGLIADDELYLRAETTNEPDLSAAGCRPFSYDGKAKPITMAYWTLPESAFDDAESMRERVNRALTAALKKAAKGKA